MQLRACRRSLLLRRALVGTDICGAGPVGPAPIHHGTHSKEIMMKILKNANESKHKVTLVCCVHGNEVFGSDVFDHFVDKLVEFPGLSIILANEKALKANKRFIDSDLNRGFPGSAHGDYESRLALNLIRAINHESFIIDIHTTTSPLSLTPIITNLSIGTKQILNQCNSREIVLMENGSKSLIGQYKSGVSLEYGEKYVKNNSVVPSIEKMIHHLLSGKAVISRQRKLFKCSGVLPKDFDLPPKSQNFSVIEGTNIIPFLIYEKNYTEYVGFALQPPKSINI